MQELRLCSAIGLHLVNNRQTYQRILCMAKHVLTCIFDRLTCEYSGDGFEEHKVRASCQLNNLT
jgi:hypothetical protein